MRFAELGDVSISNMGGESVESANQPPLIQLQTSRFRPTGCRARPSLLTPVKRND
jgi:hypothetical protein